MKSCDRRRRNSVLLIKAVVKVNPFIGKANVGSGSILSRRFVVGYNL